MAMVACCATTSAIVAVILVSAPQVVMMYEEEAATRKLAEPCLQVYCLAFFIHSFRKVLQGAMCGLGLQAEAQVPAALSFALVGLPTAWYFTFKLKFGIIGLWLAHAAGSLVLCIFYVHELWRVTWSAQILNM